MARRLLPLLVALLLVAATPAAGQAPPAPPAPPPPTAKAFIVVDGDSGAVIAGQNERQPQLPASIFKVFTALLAVEHLKPDTPVPVSPLAESMPARKINLKSGQVWRMDDMLHALLMISANDAAVALAERVGGTLDGFDAIMQQTAQRLGMEDQPILRDPAGLDDEFSYQGGNLISARDLAIVTRAALAYPEIAGIVVLPEYRFVGGDGNPHHLLNHNRLLKTYPGAVGVKTGHTRRAGRSLIASARRDGRTMVTVVLGGADPYVTASALLDRGFGTPPAVLASVDHLPEVALPPVPTLEPASAAPVPTLPRRAVPAPRRGHTGAALPSANFALLAAVVPAIGILFLRRRHRRRRKIFSWS